MSSMLLIAATYTPALVTAVRALGTGGMEGGWAGHPAPLMGMGSSSTPCSPWLQWGQPACSCPPLHSHQPKLPSLAWLPLRFDSLDVTLNFIHRCHELEANAVALIHREDLHVEHRGE